MPEARQIQLTNWQHTCPQCGYENGYHVSFRRTTPDEHGNDVAVVLICPSCSSPFDIGLRMRLSQVPKA